MATGPLSQTDGGEEGTRASRPFERQTLLTTGRALTEAHRLVVIGLENGAAVRLPRHDLATLARALPADARVGIGAG